MKTAIKSILTYLIDNVEELSKNHYASVHFIERGLNGLYRVHIHHVIPNIIAADCSDDHIDTISEVVRDLHNPNIIWDDQSLWLTIIVS
jgi:hypothetical protein